MHKKLNSEGLTEQDVAHWEEFCQTYQINKKDSIQPKRLSSNIKATNEAESSTTGGLSLEDLSNWTAFCENNDLPQKHLQGVEQQEVEEKPQRNRNKETSPIVLPPKPQKAHTPSRSNIDSKVLKKLRLGLINPERSLDLHGMFREEATQKVLRFVIEAYNNGNRLLLVIPGKGKDTEGRRGYGTLNRLITPLLSSKPISQYILHFQTAHSSHGGSGAYYVYLKRNKSLR